MKEQRVESRGQRAEGRERRAKSVEHRVQSDKRGVYKLLALSFFLLALSVWPLAGTCFAEDRLFVINAKKFSYTPHIIKVNKGDKVSIRLISEDVHHGLFIDAYNIKTSAYPGTEGFLTFVADKTGRFSFRCSVTCGAFHPYMIGYLVVGPNSRFIFYLLVTLLLAMSNLFLIFRKNKETENVQEG